MRAHFFDLDVLLVTDAKIWIIDKTNPSIPIMKISQSDFNLIKSGIYRSQNNSIRFGDHLYWLPNDIFNTLKIKLKIHKSDISDISFSMQEYLNKELIENINYDINIENILHLKNTDDDIYIICSKNTKKNYELMISKIEDKLEENGLKIKKYYYISETFYNRNDDDVSNKKIRLLLQHITGLKTDVDKFTEEEIEKYDEIFFYDDEDNAIKLAKDSNRVMNILIFNTDDIIKEKVKENLKSKPVLSVNKVTSNRVSKFSTTKVFIQYSNLIKKFENFKFKK